MFVVVCWLLAFFVEREKNHLLHFNWYENSSVWRSRAHNNSEMSFSSTDDVIVYIYMENEFSVFIVFNATSILFSTKFICLCIRKFAQKPNHNHTDKQIQWQKNQGANQLRKYFFMLLQGITLICWELLSNELLLN